MDNKENIADSYNSVFDENISYVEDEKFENREYFQHVHGGELDEWGYVLFTRSQYTKQYLEIEENYQKEKKEQIKSICIVCAIFVVATIILFIVEKIMQANPMLLNVVINALVTGARLLSVAALLFFVLGLLKKLKQLKKHRQLAIDRLNAFKNEHMTNGTYDVGR